MAPSDIAAASAAQEISGAGEAPEEYPELFEGPEKTLCLSFKARKIAAKSLRRIPQPEWEEILKHAKCEILSVVDSTPPVPAQPARSDAVKKSSKAVVTNGLTGYLLSESSLFVSDTTLTLKTCGRTTPLLALEPILDLVVPSWKSKEPEQYLKYASFMRLGYMRPDEQLEPHTSWEQEVEHMEKYVRGESVVLGSEATSKQHVYVANYLPPGEVADVFSTQVALTDLDTTESMHRYGGGEEGLAPGVDKTPLASAWPALHGDGKRSLAKDALFDEKFFEPIGYSANAVAGRHFSTVHITPQPGCSYLSVETSMPMTAEARKNFAQGASGMCRADTLALTEFALSPSLFNGGSPPEIPGFEVRRTSSTVGSFAVAHHHYERKPADGMRPMDSMRTMSPAASVVSSPSYSVAAEPALNSDLLEDLPPLPAVAWMEEGDVASVYKRQLLSSEAEEAPVLR